MPTDVNRRRLLTVPKLEDAGGNASWSFATSIGSIVSAFIAASCCVGPLVFALLGIGGAGLFVKFEPYQPYFVALTFALLGGGFYVTYRKPKVAPAGATAGADCACPAPRAKRTGKVMLWVATVLVLGFLIFPLLAPYLLG